MSFQEHWIQALWDGVIRKSFPFSFLFLPLLHKDGDIGYMQTACMVSLQICMALYGVDRRLGVEYDAHIYTYMTCR